MKKIKFMMLAGLLVLLTLSICSCDNSDVPQKGKKVATALKIEIPDQSDLKSVSTKGESFYLTISAPAEWEISISPASAKEWLSVDQLKGEEGVEHLDLEVKIQENTSAERTAKLILTSEGEQVSYIITQHASSNGGNNGNNGGDNGENGGNNNNGGDNNGGNGSGNDGNGDLNGEHINGDLTLLELPKLAGGVNNYFVTLKTSDGIVNYSLEYDVDKRHSRWVAFQFNKETARTTARKRTDAWGWDNKYIPASFSTDNWFRGTGYSRGHLVASSDRYYSREANMQTFNYFNMTPQNQGHNGGIWGKMEKRLQSWGRDASFRDVIYIVKGGTIRDDQILERKIRRKMVIPKYFWMAFVVKKGKTYHGLAFWTEHRGYDKSVSIRSLMISIDELERKTGLDLFHNFPNELEDKFEAETVNDFRWKGL